MVGKKTAIKLRKMGFSTIGDVARCNVERLVREFKNFGNVKKSIYMSKEY